MAFGFKNYFKAIGGLYKSILDPAGNFGKKGNYAVGATQGVESALGAHQATETSRALSTQAKAQKALDDELAAKKAAEQEQVRNIAAANRLREMWSLSGPYTRNNTIFTSAQGTIGQPNLGGGLSSLVRVLIGG